MSGPNPGESDRRGRSPAERIGQTSNNQPSDNEHPATRNYCSGASDSPILPKATDDVDVNDPSAAGDSNSNQRHPRQRQRRPRVANSASKAKDKEMVYGAEHVILLFVPVTLCMIFVVATIASIKSYSEDTGNYMVYTPFHEQTDDTGTMFWQGAANAAIIVGLVIIMSFVVVLLYLHKYYKIVDWWLKFTSVFVLFVFSSLFLRGVLVTCDVPLDIITTALIIWNFGVGGIFCIHSKGPLILQQAYLIFMSALIALTFIQHLPGWTTWTLLAYMVVWDLIAVLCPKGPLRMLVEAMHQRNEQISPAMIYSSAMLWQVAMAEGEGNRSKNKNRNQVDDDDGKDDEDGAVGGPSLQDSLFSVSAIQAIGDMTLGFGNRGSNTDPRSPLPKYESTSKRAEGSEMAMSEAAAGESSVDVKIQKKSRARSQGLSNQQLASSAPEHEEHQQQAGRAEAEMEEDGGIRLGLGDFIFYSILVGKASSAGDWNATVACFVAILVGLCCTLILLAVFRKALPALPISLTFGLVFQLATSTLIGPFMDKLNSQQVYV